MWSLDRIERIAIQLLKEKQLKVKPLIWARIPFENAAEAYEMIGERPGEKAKILLTYDE